MDQQEIERRLEALDGWEYSDGKLRCNFQFPDFVRAFGWMTSVALEAEKHNHHPDWKNVYNRVFVELSTHDVGAVTDKDFALAAAMNHLFA